jgi:hypothetical protein
VQPYGSREGEAFSDFDDVGAFEVGAVLGDELGRLSERVWVRVVGA